MNEIVYRSMTPPELSRLGEIDRTERIEGIYLQRGTELEESAQTFDVPPWFTEEDSDSNHALRHQRAFCERHLAAGGQASGAFDGQRLVGIGIVMPHIRPGIAQLAYLHVSNGYRGQGIGRRLAEEMERIARAAGDTEIVVSATPSLNTVRFYRGLGFAPTAEPLPELYELEPEDVHLSKQLT
jgi:ribosomal protein S18 acetylase RimI-like enzyme